MQRCCKNLSSHWLVQIRGHGRTADRGIASLAEALPRIAVIGYGLLSRLLQRAVADEAEPAPTKIAALVFDGGITNGG
jgi:hypothetical protein